MIAALVVICVAHLTVPARAAGDADADPPVRVLVQSVLRDNRPDPALAQMLIEHLARGGETVVTGVRLRPAEQTCDDLECWMGLLEKHQADLLVHAKVFQVNDTRALRVYLFDRRTSNRLEERDQVAPEQLGDALRDRVGRLLTQHRAPPPSVQVPELPPTAGVSAPAPRGPRPAWRKKLAIGLGGAAVAALATGVTLMALDGKTAPGSCPLSFNSTCEWDNRMGYTISYSTAGGLAASALLALVWP